MAVWWTPTSDLRGLYAHSHAVEEASVSVSKATDFKRFHAIPKSQLEVEERVAEPEEDMA